MGASKFQPQEFIDFCRNLLSFQDSLNKEALFNEEALFRTIVNRCYIAVFLTAKQLLKEKNYQFEDNYKDYKKVEKYLQEEFGSTGVQLKYKLRGLRLARKNADYTYPHKGVLDRKHIDYQIEVARDTVNELAS